LSIDPSSIDKVVCQTNLNRLLTANASPLRIARHRARRPTSRPSCRIARIVGRNFAVTTMCHSLYDRNITMPFDPNRHHRRSIRLAGYDYTQAGAYFVTICAYQRQRIFGDIRDGKVAPSKIGRIVTGCWLALPRHFPHVVLDAWVLMPDHLHGIILIRDDGPNVTPATPVMPVPVQPPNGTRPGSLNAIVQNFKSISTRRANRANRTLGSHLWQRDYYEHIIRDERALDAIRRYIDTNPAQWASR
jgi:putative transposase